MDKGSYIVGIDEAGRGPLAGPVAVGIFVIRNNSVLRPKNKKLKLKDSKKLTERQREEWFDEITFWKKQGKVEFEVLYGSSSLIDKKGIAVVIRMLIDRGLQKLHIPHTTHIYLDGSLRAPSHFIRQKTIIKGDEKIRVISFASICAKVLRDNYMKTISKKYPKHTLWQHKGYGTKEHRDAIRKHGVTPIHRLSFLTKITRNK